MAYRSYLIYFPILEKGIVELLEAAVPIPITVRMDAVKVIRRDSEEEGAEE